ncbi:MAG: cupin domain-containing protein [Acidobacteria bacterium]|nr:cupin domain-containing protein [Acidobacteriota bacterium]
MRGLVAITTAVGTITVAAWMSASRIAGLAQGSPEGPGLILQKAEGERRVRRPRPEAAGKVAASTMVIKVDQRNGGSPNFFMATEEILPGDAIAPHLHPEYDEILFVHRGTGLATLGARGATVTEGATLYIPSNTRVSLKNTGREPLSLVFIFPRPEMVSAYYRELTVAEGQRVIPFSNEEFAAFRARHKAHVSFDK